MKVVIQRVKKSKVLINSLKEENINNGLMILVGMTYNDNEGDIEYIVKKILNLRIFDDEDGKMNYSVMDISGEILLISQFTLYANTKNGNKPSYKESLPFDEALILFNKLVSSFRKSNLSIKTGEFGSNMEVSLINDGPVTIIIDSKER